MNQDFTEYTLKVAELQITIRVPRRELEEVHLPLLRELGKKAESKKSGRFIVFLAGPTGSYKSTTALLWEKLAPKEISTPLQALSLDGFHHANAFLDANTIVRDGKEVSLRSIKGAPETFDLHEFTIDLQKLRQGEEMRWPLYSRKIHEFIAEAISVIKDGICVVEGNYLLLNEPGWQKVAKMCDLSIFIEGNEPVARAKTIARHELGGKTHEAALAHYMRSDFRNFQRIMENRLPADIILHVDENGELRRSLME